MTKNSTKNNQYTKISQNNFVHNIREARNKFVSYLGCSKIYQKICANAKILSLAYLYFFYIIHLNFLKQPFIQSIKCIIFIFFILKSIYGTGYYTYMTKLGSAYLLVEWYVVLVNNCYIPYYYLKPLSPGSCEGSFLISFCWLIRVLD